MRHDADIAGQLLRVADLLQIRRVALDRVQDAHAVRAAQRDACLTADIGDLLLQRAPFFAALGEAAVVDHGATDAALGGGDEGVEHEPMTEAENRYIRRFRRVGDARVAFTAEHAWVVRVDRKDSAGKADAVERDDQPPADCRLLGSADDGDRFRPKQRVEPHAALPALMGRGLRSHAEIAAATGGGSL